MSNKEIIGAFRLTALLMELHDENPFKIRGYSSTVLNLDKLEQPISTLSEAEIEQVAGKSFAAKVLALLKGQSLPELEKLKAETPEGVIRMTGIKGLGPKKIRTLWKEHQLDSPEKLLDACNSNQIAKLKGFGEKSQDSIKEAILFVQSNEGKLLFEEAEAISNEIVASLLQWDLTKGVRIAGEARLQLDIVENLKFIIPSDSPTEVQDILDKLPYAKQDMALSGPFAWRGKFTPKGTNIEFLICYPEKLVNELLIQSAAPEHLQKSSGGSSLLHILRHEEFETEQAVYERLQLPYIVPEMRQGHQEWAWAEKYKPEDLVKLGQLKGVLHNHSTYSDGAATLEQMASYCAELGYQYLGISDHSQTASYAGGLTEEKVMQQHREIEKLNAEMGGFRIFKGIESDILPDGSLDYPDEILASFDFIVASVHAGLSMDIVKATDRLIKAINNPYTTFLGHPTGRLLLKRSGYPLDFNAIIDACAENNVIIEINANPWRLDIDWTWVHLCMEKGVMLSINPDAHEKVGYHDMYYGICAGRKGGLTTNFTFNAKSLAEVDQYFTKRKQNIKSKLGIEIG